MDNKYYNNYLKYKNKYLRLKQFGGGVKKLSINAKPFIPEPIQETIEYRNTQINYENASKYLRIVFDELFDIVNFYRRTKLSEKCNVLLIDYMNVIRDYAFLNELSLFWLNFKEKLVKKLRIKLRIKRLKVEDIDYLDNLFMTEKNQYDVLPFLDCNNPLIIELFKLWLSYYKTNRLFIIIRQDTHNNIQMDSDDSIINIGISCYNNSIACHIQREIKHESDDHFLILLYQIFAEFGRVEPNFTVKILSKDYYRWYSIKLYYILKQGILSDIFKKLDIEPKIDSMNNIINHDLVYANFILSNINDKEVFMSFGSQLNIPFNSLIKKETYLIEN